MISGNPDKIPALVDPHVKPLKEDGLYVLPLAFYPDRKRDKEFYSDPDIHSYSYVAFPH